MNNKAQLNPRNYVIAIILMSAIIILTYLMVGSVAVNYNREDMLDPSFRAHYDNLNQTTKLTEDIFNSVSNKSGLGLIESGEIFLKSTFSVITLIFGSFKNLGSQITFIGSDFGIPSQVTVVILLVFLSIVTTAIIFVIINAVNRTDKL